MSMIRFGYKASAEQFGPTELLRFGALAEEVGFDSVFVSDHLQPWRHDGGHAPAALPWLGALGERTERVVIGTSVLTPTFRYHPAVVAQAFATLGCLYPGRVVLGVGSGESINEAPLGVAWPEPKERFGRLKEAVELIKLLWSQDRVDFDGTYFRYSRPPSTTGRTCRAALHRRFRPGRHSTGRRRADGFITTSGKDPALYTETLLPAVREGAERAGRSIADLDLQIEVKVSFDEDADRALSDTHFWAALALTQEEKTGVEDPIEMQRLADQLSIERAASRFIVGNDPEAHVAAVLRYVECGFTHLVFHARDQTRNVS
jgi:coenzyme F420-dependent glucose-6-phosphate dehydrogenase